MAIKIVSTKKLITRDPIPTCLIMLALFAANKRIITALTVDSLTINHLIV